MIDGNDVCSFITTCRQAAWLRNMISVAQQRLVDLREPTSICAMCSGRKTIMKNVGANMTAVPCPSCVPVPPAEDPKIVAKQEERLNSLQEQILRLNAENAELKTKIKAVPVAAQPVVSDQIAKDERVVIAGGPRTGKTTMANAMGEASKVSVKHADDLIDEHDWSGASQKVADFFSSPGPWMVEGVASVRALRKWLKQHTEGKPCDKVMYLNDAVVPLNEGQERMAKGCLTVWNEIVGELQKRGVEIVRMRPETPINQDPVIGHTSPVPALPKEQEPVECFNESEPKSYDEQMSELAGV